MTRVSRYAYIQAKVFGLYSHAFLGDRLREIGGAKRVHELFTMLFPGVDADLPEISLASELERRIEQAAVRTLTDVLDLLPEPSSILIHLLRKYEYRRVKSMLRAFRRNEDDGIPGWDLGRYGGFRRPKGPGIEAALRASPYDWVLRRAQSEPPAIVDNLLDREYFQTLLDLARALQPADRSGVCRLVSLEVSLRNALWALRLRFYYGLDWERAEALLLPESSSMMRKHLARVFEIPADSGEGWRSWKFGWLVEDQLRDEFHAPDPIRAEEKAELYLLRRTLSHFHQSPFTLLPLYAFFKLKEHESSVLASAVEALLLAEGGSG